MIHVIINPVSGPAGRRTPDRAAIATRVLAASGQPHKIHLTERRNHAYDLAAAAVASGAALVIAWGGDGTVNEVGRAVALTEVPLGLVPGGSGNGFARELKLPFDPEAALKRAISGADRRVDVGEMSGRLFFNVAGIGFDAKVASSVSKIVRRRGLQTYLAEGTRELFTGSAERYTIESDAGSFRTEALTVALANSRQYGYGAQIAPAASMDDGRLDLVIVEHRSLLRNLTRVPWLFIGGFDRCDGVIARQIRDVRVASAGSMLFHVDGEVAECNGEISARVHAGALRVRA